MSKLLKWAIGAGVGFVWQVKERNWTAAILFAVICAILLIWDAINVNIKSAPARKAAEEKIKKEIETAASQAYFAAQAAGVEEGEKIIEMDLDERPVPAWKKKAIIDFWQKCFLEIDNNYESIIADLLTILDDDKYSDALVDFSLAVALECWNRSRNSSSRYDADDEKNKIITYKLMIIGLAHDLSCLPRSIKSIPSMPGIDKMGEAINLCKRLKNTAPHLLHTDTILEKHICNIWLTVRRRVVAKEQEQQPLLPKKTGGKPTKSAQSSMKYDHKNPKRMPPDFNVDKFRKALYYTINKVVGKYNWLSFSSDDVDNVIWFQLNTIFEVLQDILGNNPEMNIPKEDKVARGEWIYGALRACGDSCVPWDKMGTPGFVQTSCDVAIYKKTERKWLTPINTVWFGSPAAIAALKSNDLITLVRTIKQAPIKTVEENK
jgi:hypothetical protein